MASKKITPDEAAVHVYNVSHSALGMVSNVYKNVLLAGSRYLDEKTDNALGRVSGAAYMAKTLHAVVGGFKDIKKEHVADILLDGKADFKGKVKQTVKLAHENFSHESTVAATMFFGKSTLVIAPAVIGITALVGLAAPAAAATVGLVAGAALTQAATYFLSTHAGHKLETTMAEKVKAGLHFLTGFRKAGKGQDPEMNQMHEIAGKMEHAAKAHGHGADGHAPGGSTEQRHGHEEHHQKFRHTLKQDLIALARVDKYPAELASFAMGIAKDCVSLFNKVSGLAPMVVQEAEVKAQASKFMQPDSSKTISYAAPATPSTASTFVATAADIKAAAEKEKQVTKAPPAKKPPSMKL